jgi:CDP-6-deoxy-D-xylo-4-hexulose-3-dehydrase
MTKWNSEVEARNEIKSLVAEYYNQFKKNDNKFKKGERINYSGRIFDEKEMCALTDATLDFWLTTGRFTEKFEKRFAELFGVKYVHLVNSGS